MQAATVLLLELSFSNIYMPEEEHNFLADAKKAIYWLYAISGCGAASRRTWQLCNTNLRRIAYGMNYDVSDLPEYVYETRRGQPAHRPHQQNFNIASTPSFYNATVHSLLNLDVANQSQETYHYYHNPPPSMVSHSQRIHSFGLLSTASSKPLRADAFFPCDQISGEFIRSFFPTIANEEPWMQ
jgi:hypothetical protein